MDSPIVEEYVVAIVLVFFIVDNILSMILVDVFSTDVGWVLVVLVAKSKPALFVEYVTGSAYSGLFVGWGLDAWEKSNA